MIPGGGGTSDVTCIADLSSREYMRTYKYDETNENRYLLSSVTHYFERDRTQQDLCNTGAVPTLASHGFEFRSGLNCFQDLITCVGNVSVV